MAERELARLGVAAVNPTNRARPVEDDDETAHEGSWQEQPTVHKGTELVWRWNGLTRTDGDDTDLAEAIKHLLQIVQANPMDRPFFGDADDILGKVNFLSHQVFGVALTEWVMVVGCGWVLRLNFPSGRSHDEFVAESFLPAIVNHQPWKVVELVDAALLKHRDKIISCLKQWQIVLERPYDAANTPPLSQLMVPDTSAFVAAKPLREQRGKKLTINDRMRLTLLNKPESKGWSVTEWMAELKCSRGGIGNSDVWQELEAARKLGKSERRKDRRHRRLKNV
jgi:hypothetical protein